MEHYTTEDLYRVKWQAAASRRLIGCPTDELRILLQSWLETPQLRPHTGSTLEAYENLSRTEMDTRIIEIDWPEGLTMIQFSQLEMAGFFQKKRVRKWMTVKLMACEKRTLDLSIGVIDVRRRLQDYLGKAFKCHVYGTVKMGQNATLYRVLMFDDRHGDILPANSAIVIHFYNTEYFLISCNDEIKRLYLEQALVVAFGARGLKKQALTIKTLEALANLIEHRKSLGVFSQFRYAQQDPIQNPLNFGRLSSATDIENKNNSSSENGQDSEGDGSDINNNNEHEDNQQQQAAITSMSQLASIHQNQSKYTKFAFVASEEEKRRIIPIQTDKMNQRYNNVEQVFGNYPLDGLELLNIKLRQRVTPVLAEYGISIQNTGMDRGMGQVESKRDKDESQMAKFFRNDEDEDQVMDKPSENDGSSENEHDNGSGNEDHGSIGGSADVHWEPTTDNTQDTTYDDPYALTIGVTCTGTNVMTGLRDLALSGFMDPPYPPWMTDLIASGASQVVITDTKMQLNSDMDVIF